MKRIRKRNKIQKRWNQHSKPRRPSRYADYYERMMDPIWTQRWENDLKRIKILKKNILSLEPVPQKKVQVIKTVNHFVKLIDLITSFVDQGILSCAPMYKSEAADSFNEMIVSFAARHESTLCYLNKTEIGKTVTTNSLYLGLFFEIADDDIKDNMQIKIHNGVKYHVDVDFSPISDWLNRRVRTSNGNLATISQSTLSFLIKEMERMLLETIDELLN